MEWFITGLDYALQHEERTNVVYHIHWKAQKTIEGFTSTVLGTTSIDTSTDTFIEYENLTELQVLKWLDAAIPQEEKDELDIVLTMRAEARVGLLTARGLPW